MGRHIRLLVGISIFWLALSVLSDGLNTLVLPVQLSAFSSQNNQATLLGLLTFIGLFAGALIQPVAGAFSDRFYPQLGRRGFIGIGLAFTLGALLIFATFQSLMGVLLGYLAIQILASVAQAGQQGLIPDLVDERRRGLASGFKGFMDLSGAMLGFVLLGQLLGSGKSWRAIVLIGALLVAAFLLAVLLTPEDRPTNRPVGKTSAIPLRKIFHIEASQHRAFLQLITARFLFLLGIYATGRFLLLFVANRLGLAQDQAAEQAGNILAGLALITILASPFGGWLADRIGRVPLMISGAVLSAVSALLLIRASSPIQILLFGGLMSLGSAAFSGGSWALLVDLVPKAESARFFGLANFSIAGSAAAAGLFGPLIDVGNRISPGLGFSVVFILAALAFLASILPVKDLRLQKDREEDGNKTKVRADTAGLAVVPLQANPTVLKEDQNS